MPTLHDETSPTNMDAPVAPPDQTAAPITSPKPQQAISAASVVETTKTSELTAAPAVQGAAPPKAAGGNLVMQVTPNGGGAPAVPLQQSQSAPQILTSVSNLKTS